MINDVINFKMADSIVCMVDNNGKAHCVVITAQVDMNFIVICERIMELQPSKKMMMTMNES